MVIHKMNVRELNKLINEHDSIWITFNGETFNYIELASELSKRGHVFKTKSDTEVIVHAMQVVKRP